MIFITIKITIKGVYKRSNALWWDKIFSRTCKDYVHSYMYMLILNLVEKRQRVPCPEFNIFSSLPFYLQYHFDLNTQPPRLVIQDKSLWESPGEAKRPGA